MEIEDDKYYCVRCEAIGDGEVRIINLKEIDIDLFNAHVDKNRGHKHVNLSDRLFEVFFIGSNYNSKYFKWFASKIRTKVASTYRAIPGYIMNLKLKEFIDKLD